MRGKTWNACVGFKFSIMRTHSNKIKSTCFLSPPPKPTVEAEAEAFLPHSTRLYALPGHHLRIKDKVSGASTYRSACWLCPSSSIARRWTRGTSSVSHALLRRKGVLMDVKNSVLVLALDIGAKGL